MCLFCDRGKDISTYKLLRGGCQRKNELKVPLLICIDCLKDEKRQEEFYKRVKEYGI